MFLVAYAHAPRFFSAVWVTWLVLDDKLKGERIGRSVTQEIVWCAKPVAIFLPQILGAIDQQFCRKSLPQTITQMQSKLAVLSTAWTKTSPSSKIDKSATPPEKTAVLSLPPRLHMYSINSCICYCDVAYKWRAWRSCELQEGLRCKYLGWLSQNPTQLLNGTIPAQLPYLAHVEPVSDLR